MRNFLVAESGATKTAWRRCVNGEVQAAWTSPGLNPNTLTEEILHQRLFAALSEEDWENSEAVYFYGSGLGPTAMQNLMRDHLSAFFPPHTQLHVHHDLLAAVHATGWDHGLVAILGTGSVACYVEQGEVVAKRGGLGYLLGDEGSGTDLGRTWLKALLEEELPAQAHQASIECLGKTPLELRRDLYQSDRPAAWLSALLPEIRPLCRYQAISRLVESRFEAFLDTVLLPLPIHREAPLAVFGSVGYYFQDQLMVACRNRDLASPQFLGDPIEGLVRYHLQKA